MPSTRFDDGRDYGFADQALALRQRTGLTQRELGALLGVSAKAIGAWEAGLSYPDAARLGPLIALYLERAAFVAGRVEEEAAALRESARARRGARRPSTRAGSRRCAARTAQPSSPRRLCPRLQPSRRGGTTGGRRRSRRWSRGAPRSWPR